MEHLLPSAAGCRHAPRATALLGEEGTSVNPNFWCGVVTGSVCGCPWVMHEQISGFLGSPADTQTRQVQTGSRIPVPGLC